MTKNDAKVAKHQETVREEILTGESFLDHGFTRPKVVFIAFFLYIWCANWHWNYIKSSST